MIVHYRRREESEGVKIYRIEVDELKCPNCGWPTSLAYVIASSESEAKSLVESGEWLCGSCMADLLVDESFILKRVLFR